MDLLDKRMSLENFFYEDSIMSTDLSQYISRKNKYYGDMPDVVKATHNAQELGSSFENYPSDYFPIPSPDQGKQFQII